MFNSMISENDIVTQNELKGICERSVFQPSQRNRIVIARSQEPSAKEVGSTRDAISQNNLVSQGGQTERHKLGDLDNSALEKMNATHHFNNNSNMSIQPGKLNRDLQNTSPPVPTGNFGLSFGPFKNQIYNQTPGRNNSLEDSMISLGATKIVPSHSLTIDLEKQEIPDAMKRIRQKQSEKKQMSVERQRRMAEQVETARGQVLEKYNIKSIL